MADTTRIKWDDGNKLAAAVSVSATAPDGLLRKSEISEGHKLLNSVFSISDARRDDTFTYYCYKNALSENTSYTIRDIESFYSTLNKYHERDFNAGIFLSAAINVIFDKNTNNPSRHDNLLISTYRQEMDHLVNLKNDNVSAIGCIGLTLKEGTIVIHGDAGHGIGSSMTGGNIIVKGNVLDSVGFQMKGGSITIQKNANDNLGTSMAGGEIVVMGNVGNYAGRAMIGGQIIVFGNAEAGLGIDSRDNAQIVVSGHYDLMASDPNVKTDLKEVIETEAWRRIKVEPKLRYR